MLTPLSSSEGALERLIAEGRATKPKGDLLDLDLAQVRLDDPYGLSKALEEHRAGRLS